MARRSHSIRLEESDGAVTILRETVALVPRMPSVVGVFGVVALVGLLSSSLGSFASLLGGAVAVSIAYGKVGGRVGAANSIGVRLLLAVIGGIIAGFCIVLGTIFFVLPGIYLLVRLRLVVAAVVLEDRGPVEALGRSFDLTEGHTWTVFGVWLVPLLVGIALGAGIVVSTSGIPSPGTVDSAAFRSSVQVAGAVTTLVTGPVGAIADTLMYGLYGPDEVGGSRSGGTAAATTADE
ncbi:hypothetical protein ACFQE1_09605 [Halobium palmae]|uniref:DUF7847 domain-containing protein n=1 Tax=Halobium palmae TaxID=1776492 RepID=A0ABD5RZ80_9EURY